MSSVPQNPEKNTENKVDWRKKANDIMQVLHTKQENKIEEFSRMYRASSELVRGYAEYALSVACIGEEHLMYDNLVRDLKSYIYTSEEILPPDARSNPRQLSWLYDVVRKLDSDTARKLQGRLIRRGLGLTTITDDKFTFKTDLDLMASPPIKWLIAGVLPEKSLSVVYGPPKSFKSFFVIDAAYSIAAGCNWMGRETEQGGVLYIAAEGVEGLGKRIKAWRKHKGIPSDVSFPFLAWGGGINLSDPNEVDKLIRSIPENFDLKLVVIDTLNRCMEGDENSSKDVKAFIDGCATLKEKLGVTVIIVHHSGKDRSKGPRGSNSIEGSVETMIEVRRDQEEFVTLINHKQKEDKEFSDIVLRSEVVDLGEGESSLVLGITEYGEYKPPATNVPPAQLAILRVLDQANGPLRPKDIYTQAKISRQTWDNHRITLLNEGKIKRNQDGTYSIITITKNNEQQEIFPWEE